jgi:endonuclease/exonuclease/phosphatase family metal-dependent hydrolase
VSAQRRRLVALLGRLLLIAGLIGCAGIAVIRATSIHERGFRMMGVAGASIVFTSITAAMALVGAVVVLANSVPTRRLLVQVLGPAILPVLVLGHMTAPTLAGAILPERADSGERFSVVAQNLLFENEEPERTLDVVVDTRADVLVLTEFTAAFDELWDARPDAEELAERYPHQWRRPAAGGQGMAVLSSLPIERIEAVPLSTPAIVATLRVGSERVDLYAVHPTAPSDHWGLLEWQHDYRVLTAAAKDADARTVMAGDFNATAGHVAFRRLLAQGELRDAHDVGGGGLVGTWPVGWPIPPLMRLDHVLVGEGIGVERFQLLEATDSDHLGVEAWLRVPRS